MIGTWKNCARRWFGGIHKNTLGGHRSKHRGLGLDRLEDRVNPAPIQFFFVPLPDQQALAALEAIGNGAQGNDTTSFIAISAQADGTIIQYDHWEDGYEINLGTPLQATTLIWGDGNAANGIPPGFAADVINAGTIINIRNDIPANPRDPNFIFFDGGDKFGSNNSLSMSRGLFPVTGGSVIASAVEARDTRYHDTTFTAPVGTNTPNQGAAGAMMFEFAQFFVMASQDSTTVSIDANNDGDFLDTALGDVNAVVINQGQNLIGGDNPGTPLVNEGLVRQGGRVVANKDVQVNLVTGDIGSSFASRSYTLFSNAQATEDWFTPVGLTGAANDDVRLYFHNPNAFAITVTPTVQSGTLAGIPVAAGATASFDVPNVLPAVTGTRLRTGDDGTATAGAATTLTDATKTWVVNQWAGRTLTITGGTGAGQSRVVTSNTPTVLTVPAWGTNPDATSTYTLSGVNFLALGTHDIAGTTHDWGFSLQPTAALSQIAQVGLGVGNSYGPPTDNTSPVWVTPLAATAVFVDVDGDPLSGPLFEPITGSRYNYQLNLAALQSARVTNFGETGTATAGAATTLTDATKAWGANQWAGLFVSIVSGTGTGQIRQITSNTPTVLTVAQAWATNPNATSVYQIKYAEAGAATAAAAPRSRMGPRLGSPINGRV